MQGIFIGNRRPKSKKEIKEAIATGNPVFSQATSFFGSEYDGMISEAPIGTKILFTGPDPERDRRFYGTITVTANGIKVI